MARTIGLIGVGLLGSALARRFRLAGHDVLGFDLSADARHALVNEGAYATGSAQDVVSACEVIVLCLPDSRVVAEVIKEADAHLRPGQLLIDVTTGEPDDAVALGQQLDQRGVMFTDATIAGSSAQVDQREVIVMAGGAPSSVHAAYWVFDCFAKEVHHVGRCGSGSRMKLVTNLVLGLNRAVLAEGLTLARTLGLDGPTALKILKAGPAYSTVMDTKGAKMLDEDFQPQARLSQHLKDVRLILHAAAEQGLELPLSSAHQALLERAEAKGLGELDNSAIIKAFGR